MTAKARAAQVVKNLAATADRVRKPRRGVVVLIYHRVGGRSGLQIDLPVELFEEQMAVLAAGQRVVALDDALPLLESPAVPAAPDPVVVTFDDGTVDFAEAAMPVLERYRIPATLYVATRFIEEQQPFPAGGDPVSWSALADAGTTGLLTIASHTHTHALLDRLAPELVDDELDRSVGLIGDRLGTEVDHFAYPKANPGSPAAERAVRARFRSAALAGTRPNPYGATDLHRLSRSPIQVADEMQWFRRKSEGGMALEDTLRRLLNRRRYAGATT
jgi:peptidoglycan/xylan/chitin deacetylase (PgdA/CDA1 family)